MDDGLTRFIFAIVLIPIALVVACATTVTCALACVWLYLEVFARALGVVGSAPAPHTDPPPSRADGVEPAYMHYLFGQALRDLRQAFATAITRGWVSARRRVEVIAGFYQAGSSGMGLVWSRLISVGLFLGFFAGIAVGSVLTIAIIVMQVVTVGVLLIVGFVLTYSLRMIDTFMLLVRGIKMRCPNCYRRIVYPSYICSNPDCGALHSDVRPGRYGVARRVCVCGKRLPTLLLLGSASMTACCPFADCGVQLSNKTGTAAEVLLPFFGAGNAGKTRLMAFMVKMLLEVAPKRGMAVDFADGETMRRYHELEPALISGDPTRATLRQAPRAYLLHINSARGPRRLVHLFDPSGEYFNESERLQELQYMRSARTFLFVVDPLSIDMLWNSLPRAEQNRLNPLRARRSPEFIFQQTLQNIEGMGVSPNKARLAVAISKTDLLAGTPAGDLTADSETIVCWLTGLGLENMVRTMRFAFCEVRFFRTTAMLSAGRVDDSVENLTEWALAGGGLRIRRTG